LYSKISIYITKLCHQFNEYSAGKSTVTNWINQSYSI